MHETFKGLPRAYVTCMMQVDRPYDVLCGHRQPTNEERRLVCDALEAMIVYFIELVLVIQLRFFELRDKYTGVSKDAMHRHAACAMLNKKPTDPLTQTDYQVSFTYFRLHRVYIIYSFFPGGGGLSRTIV